MLKKIFCIFILTFLTTTKKPFFSNNSRVLCKKHHHRPRGRIDGISALGHQYDTGAAWAIICKNTPYGNVPGKRDNPGGAYYPWGGKEHRCHSYDLVGGKLIHVSQEIPCSCEPKGYQTNDHQYYFNVVIDGIHGLVPGKATEDLKHAWYSWGGKDWYASKNFYVVC